MGFTPQEIDQMSIWQFLTVIEGWMTANGSGEDEGKVGSMGAKQADEIWEWLKSKDDVPLTRMH